MYSVTAGGASSRGRHGGWGVVWRDSGPARARPRGLALMAALPAAAVVVALLAAVEPARSQDAGRLTGVFAGRTESEQDWSPPVETSPRPGFMLGAFIDTRTPAGALRVRAEGGFAQRGGFVSSDHRGEGLDGEVRSDYLTFLLQAKVAGSLGPLHIFAAAGPGLDYLVRSREDPVLAQVLADEHDSVLNVAASAGAGARLGGTWVAEVEARLVHGMTGAYSGTNVEVGNRSLEWMVRVSRARETS